MTVKVKSKAVNKQNGRNIVSPKRVKRLTIKATRAQHSAAKELNKPHVVMAQRNRSASDIYRDMYDQEERDIARAVKTLSKYTR